MGETLSPQDHLRAIVDEIQWGGSLDPIEQLWMVSRILQLEAQLQVIWKIDCFDCNSTELAISVYKLNPE
mgnify:CR=1 FL=1